MEVDRYWRKGVQSFTKSYFAKSLAQNSPVEIFLKMQLKIKFLERKKLWHVQMLFNEHSRRNMLDETVEQQMAPSGRWGGLILQVVPVDDDEVCQICKNMVAQARDTLESNETQVTSQSPLK